MPQRHHLTPAQRSGNKANATARAGGGSFVPNDSKGYGGMNTVPAAPAPSPAAQGPRRVRRYTH